MSISNWNSLSADFSAINDFSRDSLFAYLRETLGELRPKRMIDYGTGDGDFAVYCAGLSIEEIVAYDPAESMIELASNACRPYPNIKVCGSTADLSSGTFDCIVFNAIWMCLPTREICIDVLKDVHRLLRSGGKLFASVTHPCFRTLKFSTSSTNFDNRNYMNDGSEFDVTLSDGTREIVIIDTHWSLSAMCDQLRTADLRIETIKEFPDRPQSGFTAEGSPWLIVSADKS